MILNDKQKIDDLLWLTREQFLNLYSYITEEEYNNTLDKMWEQFGDIPVNKDGTIIEEDFYYWVKGTEKEDIWHWFDIRLEEGIGKRYFN